MNKLSKVRFLLLFFFWCIEHTAYICAVPKDTAKKELSDALKKLAFDIPIRVLLEEKDALDQAVWSVESQDGFLLVLPEGKRIIYKKPLVKLSNTTNSLLINNKPFAMSHLFIIPLDGHIKYKGIEYHGIFAFTKIDTAVYLVNHVELEDYVVSVLPSESWPGWPDEVNKAFCIGFRSYGIAKVLEHRKLYAKKKIALPYDIKNTRVHQVYKGRAQDDKFRKIAQETRGIVLAHKNQPILAMFDICCGGAVPSRIKGISFAQTPYLARSYPCSYCKDYKFYRWEYSYPTKEFEELLKKELPKLGTLKDVKISRKDGAGIVHEVSIRGSRGWFTLAGSKFKSLLKDLKSFCFTVQKRGNLVIIKGKGFGHLKGLCQRGAHKMVTQGWTYKNILKFYYPHTTFMKLSKLAVGN